MLIFITYQGIFMKHTTAVLILLSLAFTDALCMEEQEEALQYRSTPLAKVKRSQYGSINDVEAQRNDDKIICWRPEQTSTVMAVCIPCCIVTGVMIWGATVLAKDSDSGNESPILPSFSNYSLSAKNH